MSICCASICCRSIFKSLLQGLLLQNLLLEEPLLQGGILSLEHLLQKHFLHNIFEQASVAEGSATGPYVAEASVAGTFFAKHLLQKHQIVNLCVEGPTHAYFFGIPNYSFKHECTSHGCLSHVTLTFVRRYQSNVDMLLCVFSQISTLKNSHVQFQSCCLN